MNKTLETIRGSWITRDRETSEANRNILHNSIDQIPVDLHERFHSIVDWADRIEASSDVIYTGRIEAALPTVCGESGCAEKNSWQGVRLSLVPPAVYLLESVAYFYQVLRAQPLTWTVGFPRLRLRKRKNLNRLLSIFSPASRLPLPLS